MIARKHIVELLGSEISIATGFSPWYRDEIKLCRPRKFTENKNSVSTHSAGALIKECAITRHDNVMPENKLQMAQGNTHIYNPDLKVGANKISSLRDFIPIISNLKLK